MKIIFLNAWYGTVADKFTTFLREQALDTDIFCLQEATDPVNAIAETALPGYQKIEARKKVTDDDHFFQVTYIKPGLSIANRTSVLADAPGIGLDVTAEIPSAAGTLNLVNFHGMSRPVDKRDDPGRLEQSRILIEYLRGKTGPKIVGGDFNLEPDTESIALFTRNAYRNLIDEFHIPTTRNKLAWIYPVKQYFSDYVFISPDVKLVSFAVPPIEISDHLPLILEVAE